MSECTESDCSRLPSRAARMVWFVVALLAVYLQSVSVANAAHTSRLLTTRLSEVNALYDLYTATDGQNWVWLNETLHGPIWDFSGILENVEPCAAPWQGLKCVQDAQNNSRVSSIKLPSKELYGTIPSSIGSFHALTELDFFQNTLSGVIPADIANLTNLSILDLGDNFLSGTVPSAVGTLTKLDHLALKDNLFNGSVIDTISSLTELKVLLLDTNEFTGRLDSSFINSIRSIFLFEMGTNLLTGTIPSEIGTLTNLIQLILATNSFTGTIPTTFSSDFLFLEIIDFSHNKLTGLIPAELGDVATLNVLFLGGNALTGGIPTSFANLTNMLYLELSGNHLTGKLPDNIGGLFRMKNMNLATNMFSGPLPLGVGMLTELQFVDLTLNKFTGTLPAEAIANLISLESFAAPNNQFSGTLPRELCQLPSLRALMIGVNYFDGNLHDRFNLSINGHFLRTVDLSGNRFTGTLPANLLSSTNLRSFSAVYNCFNTPIPESICGAVNLRAFSIDGIGSDVSCTRSSVFGTYITDMGVLGTIPRCLFTLPHIESIDMASNAIMDTIDGVESVSESLTELSLSHNLIKRSIPEAIQLHPWEKIDLSHNNIDGTLNEAIVPVNTSKWKLHVNRLSGKIPPGFRTHTGVRMVEGNIFQCTPSRVELPKHDQDAKNYQCGTYAFQVQVYVWISIFLASALGALIFTAVLHPDFLGGLVTLWKEGTLIVASGAESKLYSKLSQLLRRLIWQIGIYTSSLGILYVVLDVSYSKYENLYALTISAGYLSGVLPGCLVLIAWIGLISFVYNTLRIRLPQLVHQRRESLKKRFHNVYENDENPGMRISSVEVATSTAANADVDPKALRAYYIYLTVATTVNLSVVILVNVGYTFANNGANGAALILARIAFAVFKLFVESKVTGIMLDFGYEKFLSQDGLEYKNRVNQSEIAFRNVLNLTQMIIIPYIITAILSPTCFYNAFAHAAPVESTYEYAECETFDLDTETCTEYTPYESFIKVLPAFEYSYLCSGYILRALLPVFMDLFYMQGFLYPAVSCLLKYVPACKSAWQSAKPKLLKWVEDSFGDCLEHLLIWWFDLKEDQPLDTLTPDQFERHVKKYFNIENFADEFVTCIALLLTFGTIFPPVGIIICVTMASLTYQMQFTYHKIVNEVNEGVRNHFITVLDAQAAHVVTYIRRSVWSIITFSCFFYSLFLFDIIGDVRSVRGTIWAPLLILLLPFILWVANIIAVNGFVKPSPDDHVRVKTSSIMSEERASADYVIDITPDSKSVAMTEFARKSEIIHHEEPKRSVVPDQSISSAGSVKQSTDTCEEVFTDVEDHVAASASAEVMGADMHTGTEGLGASPTESMRPDPKNPMHTSTKL